jgi:geranylgeranyl pyrophosphate synthase
VKPTCLAAMELKTGALMSLAFDLGAFIADQRPLPSSLGVSLGQRFGVALQMFDDIGNFLLPPPKGKEDFINRRPSFLWAMAASESTPLEYSEFLQCVEALPDAQPLEEWAKHHHLIERAKTEASQSLKSILNDLKLTSDLENRIKTLFQKLESAYV